MKPRAEIDHIAPIASQLRFGKRKPGRLLRQFALQATEKNLPLQVTLEITKRCNLKCRHCYSVPRPDRMELSTSRIVALFSELRRAGTLTLALTGGEVGMHPDFPFFLQEATRQNLLLKINTNGTCFSDEIIRLLGQSNVAEVGVSLYGADAETHETVTGIAGSFERTLSTARSLQKAGILIYARFVLMAGNVSRYEQMVRMAESMQLPWSATDTIHQREDGGKDPLCLRPSDRELYCFRALRGGVSSTRAPSAPGTACAEEFMCSIARDAAFISAYGQVYPCPQLPLEAGDLHRQPFDQIWKDSPLLEQLRQAKAEDFSDCCHCAIRQHCRRCTAMAYAESGTLFGPASECCRQARINEKLARST